MKRNFNANESILFYRSPILEKGINQVAFIICTSGTTGFPKGVCISHVALLHILKSYARNTCPANRTYKAGLNYVHGEKSLLEIKDFYHYTERIERKVPL